MFLVGRIPGKTLGTASHKIGGHKRTIEEAGIATTGIFRELYTGITVQWKLIKP